MRIISGNLRGKKIFEPLDNASKPKEPTPENKSKIIELFKLISNLFEWLIMLKTDSFTRSFNGLVVLSRGASFTIFVEYYFEVLPILKKNINYLNLNDKCLIFEKDIFQDLDFKSFTKKFDIIFLDPPFKNENKYLLITKIYDSKILNKKGIIIMHINSKEKESFASYFNILEEKKYGNSKIIFGNFT